MKSQDLKSRSGPGAKGVKPPAQPAATVNGLKTGLTVLTPEDITYQAALEKAKNSREYQTLKGVCESPYLTGENYNWISNFIERRASKFWRYLELREAGKRDKDKVRAASILEYSRLLAELVKNYPEFREKILNEVVKQYPEEFKGRNPYGPAELVARLEQLNQQDYLEVKPGLPQPGPGAVPPGSQPSPDPLGVFDAAKGVQIIQDIYRGIEEHIHSSSPQFVSFGFDAKCALLGSSEWARIIDGVRRKYPELSSMSRVEILEHLCRTNHDPKIKKILHYVKQVEI